MNYVDSVQRAIDFIEENLHQEIELLSVANEAFMSQAQLYRVFYALTGHPVKEYIRKRRMSVAAEHLRNSRQSVTDIAWNSGFESYHSFAKMFKKIVGLTPAAYREADIYFSFEPIRLREKVAYVEEREQSEAFPDVKVVRLWPAKVHTLLHVAEREEGIEQEAFQKVYERISRLKWNVSKLRYFGHNVDLPADKGSPRYGYRMMVMAGEGETATYDEDFFREEEFPGGLYSVRKTPASQPELVIEAWDRLLAEWLPKSTFERAKHQYVEEFIAYNGKISRMYLYLPVERRVHPEQIEIVELEEAAAVFCRGCGSKAQQDAERRLIGWFERARRARELEWRGRYYMSFQYGNQDPEEDYWWENGIVGSDLEAELSGEVGKKSFRAGLYACCVTKTYGLLTGVLDKMHRWIAANQNFTLDEDRQWFAEYHTFEGTDIETDSIVKIYIPIMRRV
ncbi:helix-turn-helix domain-containing protein [Paenibacillus alkalitolerans]|uniref:helix-turn-helix domain-containing protein n=1 Tax=Paenibacillus alkalitolerans TaxID=2799335 RepID=UPI0018F5754F|nr:helix-turn-helix domain-containing protein [Paenibacillus alkalitolerans]